MIRYIGFGAIMGMVVLGAAAEEPHRELRAHEHGHSRLNVAIEDSIVLMELTSPGADIVGFEHEAENEEDRAALREAETKLAQPLSLFTPPNEAGCKVASVAIELEGEDHQSEHHDDDAEHGDHDEAEHAEFHATYRLDCTDPLSLTRFHFAFFDHFPNAEEVEVAIISERGQSSFEVTRAEPRLDLNRVGF